MITTERQAFDISLEQNRIQERKGTTLDPERAKKISIKGIAKDWSGFAWEYGLREKLRFTPYDHTYYQVFDFNAFSFNMVDGDDLDTGLDFRARMDKTERNGLIAVQYEALRFKFLNSRTRDKFIWTSPKSDPGEGFSDYSFAYFGQVEDSADGKRLLVYDFLNDLSRQDFAEMMGLSSEISMSDLMCSIQDLPADETVESFWGKLIAVKNDHKIFGNSLDQVLKSVNLPLLQKTKQMSQKEAQVIYNELQNGVSVAILQASIRQRLKNFVLEVTEGYVLSDNEIFGSCGTVGMPEWVEYNTITGEFHCKFCKKGLTRAEANSHRCVC